MGLSEIKLEVINELSKIEEGGKMQEVLVFLKTISDQKTPYLNLTQHYDKVNNQYANVLKKLAQ